MRVALARTLVSLAARALGPGHRDWADAMRAELDVAIEDGRPLGFAAGCLVGACRQLPRFAEGRLALASNALAIGLIVPLAALFLWVGFLGYPYLAFGDVGLSGFIAGRSEQIPLLQVGELALAPALTMVVLLQGLGQLLLAWFLLDRNWARVSAVGRLNAAALTTQLAVTSMLAVTGTSALIAIAALITETLAVLALAWWHEHLPHEAMVEAASR